MNIYKTTEKYLLGQHNGVFVNVAMVEQLAPRRNGTLKPETVIHMFGDANLVLDDLSAKYQLPENIVLYKVQELANFAAFKCNNDRTMQSYPHLFMMNRSNGLWDSRWTDTYAPMHILLFDNDPFRDEAWCVKEMLPQVRWMGCHADECFIRPVPRNYPRRMADMTFVHPRHNAEKARTLRLFANAVKRTPSGQIPLPVEITR